MAAVRGGEGSQRGCGGMTWPNAGLDLDFVVAVDVVVVVGFVGRAVDCCF